MPVTLVSSDRFAAHLTPPGHPERVARAHVMQAVTEKWASEGIPVLAPRPATREELLLVHTAGYLARIEATAGRAMMLDPDTFTSPQSAEVAALAAGAGIVAIDAVVGAGAEASSARATGTRNRPASALALVRPPGHHAGAARAMGFCIYNTVAIAARHALARGIGRIAIVDHDVHHGNGTQSAFYDDPRVLFISTHQFPFYPGSGAAREVGSKHGEGLTVNVPLEAGATDGDYAMVFDRLVMPVLAAFGPQLLLVSAGFDAHMRDPLAGMRMSVAGFTALAGRLHAFAASMPCPAVFITEGGYHLKALAACLDGLVTVLSGSPHTRCAARDAAPVPVTGGGPEAEPLSPDEAPLVEHVVAEPTHRGPAAVEIVREAQKRYWPGL